MENLSGSAGEELPPTSSAPARYLSFGAMLQLSVRLLIERLVRLVGLTIICAVLFCLGFSAFCGLALLCQEEANLLLLLLAISLVFVLTLLLLEHIACFSLLGDGRLRVGEAFNASPAFLLSYIKGWCALALIGLDCCLPFMLMVIFLLLALTFYDALAAAVGSSLVLNLAPTVYLMSALVICAVSLFTLPFFFCLSLLESFFAFSLIIDRRPVRESLAYAYGLIRRHLAFVLSRFFLFLLLYLSAAGLLALFSSFHPSGLLALCIPIMSCVLSFYLLAFLYVLYRNLQTMEGPAVKEQDRRAITYLFWLGLAVLLLPLFALVALLLLGTYAGQLSSAPRPTTPGQIEQASLPAVRI